MTGLRPARAVRPWVQTGGAGILATAVSVLLACSPGAATQGQRESGPAPERTRTMIMLSRVEPPSLAALPLQSAGQRNSAPELFNATLDYIDERGEPHPYLAEAIPELQTPSWRLLPDGRMETSYRLKPNLTWHDGRPLAAEDFVFAWRVYSAPEIGAAGSTIRAMEEVTAPDSRTILIRWRQPDPDARALGSSFQALPRHVLGDLFDQRQIETLVNHPFWRGEYVGLGPYALERWEPGVFIEGIAFAAHVLGRPRIDRVQYKVVGDPRTAAANLLSGAAHIVVDAALQYDDAVTLQREWAPRHGGVLLANQTGFRTTQIQFRPELVNPQAILDLRVRKALAHAMDKQAMSDALFDGLALVSDTIISPRVAYYPAIEPSIAKYPYDLRRASELLEETGFRRRPDGTYANQQGEPLKFEVWTLSGGSNERENAIIVDGFKRAGLEASSYVIPPAQISDNQVRASFTALSSTGGGGTESAIVNYSRSSIPGPQNRWQGSNRGAWPNAEYDRLADAYRTTLDRNERIQQIAQMLKLLSEEVVVIPHYSNVRPVVHVSALRGPVAQETPDAGPEVNYVYKWELD